MWIGEMASGRKVGWGLVVDVILMLKARLVKSKLVTIPSAWLQESWKGFACKGIRPGLLPEAC